MIRHMAMAVTMAVLASAASAAQTAPAGIPTTAPGWDPEEFQLTQDGPCSLELREASDLLQLRAAGQSKEKAGKSLPATGATAELAASVLDDIYANPDISHFPYFVYRNVTCMRRHIGRPVPATLTAVSSQVMACQTKFGVEASDRLIGCIQQAATPKQ